MNTDKNLFERIYYVVYLLKQQESVSDLCLKNVALFKQKHFTEVVLSKLLKQWVIKTSVMLSES